MDEVVPAKGSMHNVAASVKTSSQSRLKRRAELAISRSLGESIGLASRWIRRHVRRIDVDSA
jgi:hypothetical protein